MTEDEESAPRHSKAEEEFSAELKRRRIAEGVSQRQLAKIIGFPRPYVSRAEKPGGHASPQIAKAIDDALHAEGVLVELHSLAVKERKARLRRIRRDEPVEAATPYSDYVDHFTIVLSSITPTDVMHSGVSSAGHARELERIQGVDRQAGPGRALNGLAQLLRGINGDLAVSRGADRFDLLRIASHAAEFAGFLYRDLGSEGQCLYWHDRAIEYSQQADDQPMQAYVLLRKAQAAYDRRDAQRMLDLTLAAQRVTKTVSPGLQAELLQQQARGEAMLGASRPEVRRRLDEASTALDVAEHQAEGNDPATYYSRQLFGFQSALCVSEAGHPGEAVDLYQMMIGPELPSRDHAYYSILMAASLALSGEPDEAARVASIALPTAADTGSRRSVREARKLSVLLDPWRGRHQIQALHSALHLAERHLAG